MTGNDMTYDKHVRTPFGQYVQTHEDHTNDMKDRSLGAICLGPTGNKQGTHFFMNLTTGALIRRLFWTPLPMTELAIRRVNSLGARQNMPLNLSFANRLGEEILETLGGLPRDAFPDEITKLKASPAPSPTSTITSTTTGVTHTELEDYVKNAINQAMRTMRTELDAKLKHHSDTIVKDMTKNFSHMLTDTMQKLMSDMKKQSDNKPSTNQHNMSMQQSPSSQATNYTPSPTQMDMHQNYQPQFSPPVYGNNFYGQGVPFHHPQMEYHDQQYYHNQYHSPPQPDLLDQETPTVAGDPQTPRNLTQDFSMTEDNPTTQL